MPHQLEPLTFPLHGTRLIEASAGTGKTYTIAALYLRLVLGHGGENGFSRALTPPEILVVTFTNAATEELRDRIRTRLTEAAAFFRGQGEGDEYLTALRGDYPAERWAASARLLDQAAQWMDEAAIHTIHSWCQRMLRQHAFDSGSLFDLTLETGDQDLLEEAARDYWRFHFYPQPAGHLEELMAESRCATPEDLLGRVRPLLNFPLGPVDDPLEILARRREVTDEVRRIWAAELDDAVRQVRDARANKVLNGNKYRAASLEKWIDQLTRWVGGEIPLPDAQALEKFSRTGLEAGVAKNKTAPEHPAYDALDRLNQRLAELTLDTALFTHAATDIARRFREEKARRAQMGFDDLLTRLRDALEQPGNDRLAQVIGRQFPVALIDEFQDTDPVQYTIFSRVYLGQEEAGLFMIGDPKQAIYAFRGADIHTYLAARDDAAGNRYTLGKNYRSTEAAVRAVNRMFGAAADYPDGAFLFRDRIPFEAVAARGREDELVIDGETIPAMTFWQLPQTGPVSKTGEEGYLHQMAEAAASEIVRLLNGAEETQCRAGFRDPEGEVTPLRPADIAILVRDRQEARAIRQSLYARRVRSVYLSDKDSIFETGEADSLLYLLRACAEPEQERVVKTALATDILDLPFARLDRLNRDELAWESEVERFRTYQRIWQRQGVLPMLRSLLREFGVPARLLSEAGGERTLTNLLHLAELLQEAAARLDGEQALIRWLAEQFRQPAGGSDEQILRLESDEELVRVVTIHKSKGLEYPLVFLPFICTFREVNKRNSPVVKYHDDAGRPKLVHSPEDGDLAAADRERLAEDLRLLYVAVTRARYACWLGVGVMGRRLKKGETSNLHKSGLGYLLSADNEIPTNRLDEVLLALKGDCEDIEIQPLPAAVPAVYQPQVEEAELLPAEEFSGTVPADWWITSYSGILAGAGMAEHGEGDADQSTIPADPPESAVEDQLREAEAEPPEAPVVTPVAGSIHRFPRGPDPGTFLHNLLEWAAGEGFSVLDHDRARIDERIEAAARRHDWGRWAKPLADWLQHLLKVPLALPDLSEPMTFSALADADYQPEMEFLFAAHGVNTRALDEAVTGAVLPGRVRPQLREAAVNGMLKGFIDLVFCFQGRYFVLDYKSNYLGETDAAYGSDAMAEAMLEHRYDLQYVIYTLALHRLLKARLPDYDYRRDVGGVVYLFLRGVDGRGQGVYVDKPPAALIQKLDSDFAGSGP